MVVLVTFGIMFGVYNAINSYLFPVLNAKAAHDTNLIDINPESPEKANSIYNFNALDIDGNIVKLSKYRGLVTYVVNVASQ